MLQLQCIENKVSLEAIRAIEAVKSKKHDNNMKHYSLWSWLITITANHSNYLVCDRANTQSVTAFRSENCNSITAMPP